MKIEMPISIKSDLAGYQSLLTVHEQVKDCLFEEIQLDFAKTKWFDANLLALFGAFLSVVKSSNNVTFSNLTIGLKKVMRRSRFILKDQTAINETYKTSIAYRKFKSEEEQLFCNYIEKELLAREELPVMSALLKKKMLQKLLEVFSNAHQHGQCDFVYSCGQYYRDKNKLSFTIVNLGTTIKDNVTSFLQKKFSAVEAIIWAVNEGTTTRPMSAGIPGGLGLTLLRTFVKLNKGKIQILSAGGLWEQDNDGNIKTTELENHLLGTIVNIEFNLQDTGSYKLINEPEIVF